MIQIWQLPCLSSLFYNSAKRKKLALLLLMNTHCKNTARAKRNGNRHTVPLLIYFISYHLFSTCKALVTSLSLSLHFFFSFILFCSSQANISPNMHINYGNWTTQAINEYILNCASASDSWHLVLISSRLSEELLYSGWLRQNSFRFEVITSCSAKSSRSQGVFPLHRLVPALPWTVIPAAEVER